MKAIITVGMGFGDEGKGATIDFLARQFQADLVVRYSGGAQAGHNVQLPDGFRHTFSHFGAGTLSGTATYLGPRMIVCPSTLKPEAENLTQYGLTNPCSQLMTHPECLLSTTYHRAMNRIREIDRGGKRHGSCGLGIGETRRYWLRYGSDAITANDTLDFRTLYSKLQLLRDRMLIEMQSISQIDDQYAQEIYNTLPRVEAEYLVEEMSEIQQSDELPDAKLALFEGAQGILLDEYFGFHPYTTWSTVTAMHALELLATKHVSQLTTLGITRAYATRHGAGPFPTRYGASKRWIEDPGNPSNQWQGQLSSGPLDLVLLKYATEACPIDAWVVNHLDELDHHSELCWRYDSTARLPLPHTQREQEKLTQRLEEVKPIYRKSSVDQIRQAIAELAPIAMEGWGPTHLDRSIVDESFLKAFSNVPEIEHVLPAR